MTSYYFLYDKTTGLINGVGVTPDGTYPPDCLPCTQEQYANPQAWQVVNGEIVAADNSVLIAMAKSSQTAKIRSSYESASTAPVTDTNKITWSGGQSSGTAIYLACQMAQQSGATDVTLWDASNTAHTMTIAEGLTVAATIGAAYQAAFQKWQTLRAQVEAATSVAEVEAITW